MATPPTIPNGDDLQRARGLWPEIAGGRFADGDLATLLLTLWKKWARGSLCADLARALLAEAQSAESDPEPEPIALAAIEHLPTTQRVDGILPLTIPKPTELRWPADELIDEVQRLKLGSRPEELERLREELALAYLALLHRRPLISDHRLPLLMVVSCPLSAFSIDRQSLMLFAGLPLGGRVTVFFSSLGAQRCCTFPAASTEHFDRLRLQRDDSGCLMLAEGRARNQQAREKWTFRL